MKKKTRGIILITFGVLVFIYFVVTPLIWVVVSKDIDQIDDTDLDIKDINIADEENAYYDLIKIEDVIYFPTGEKNEFVLVNEENNWDEKIVEELLLKNEEAFGYFDDASQKSYFQNPEWSNSENLSSNTITKGLNTFRKIAELSNIKAKNLVKKGKSAEALEESFKIVSVGNKIKNSQGLLIQYLVGVGIESNGLKAIIKIVKENELTKEELILYSNKLTKFSSSNEHLKNIIKIEYKLTKDMIDSEVLNREEGITLEDGVGEYTSVFRLINFIMPFNNTGKFYYKPNKTKLLFANQARIDINKVRDNACNSQDLKDIQVDYSDGDGAIIEENFKGKYIFNILSSSHLSNEWIRKECQEEFVLASTRLLLLLNAYKNQNGSYPEKLEYLVPEYIDKIEFYPFESDEINYSNDKGIIFYKGEDILSYEKSNENFYMLKNLIISLD